MDANKIIQQYMKGSMVRIEAVFQIVSLFTLENAETIFSALPPEWQKEVEEEVATAPTTNWDQLRLLWIGSHTSTAEEMEKRQRKVLARYRVGIEALRTYFDTRSSE